MIPGAAFTPLGQVGHERGVVARAPARAVNASRPRPIGDMAVPVDGLRGHHYLSRADERVEPAANASISAACSAVERSARFNAVRRHDGVAGRWER